MSADPEFSINAYKRKYDRELRHVKMIMMAQKSAMSKAAWIRFVMATRKSILASPETYFRSVPDKEIFVQAIDKVFKGFLDDQKIRDAQRRL